MRNLKRGQVGGSSQIMLVSSPTREIYHTLRVLKPSTPSDLEDNTPRKVH